MTEDQAALARELYRLARRYPGTPEQAERHARRGLLLYGVPEPRASQLAAQARRAESESALTVAVLTHDRLREVRCCLCGAAWEEVLVTAALVVQGSSVGALCPRCLSRPPAEAVPRAGGLEEFLKGLAADLAGVSRWPVTVAEVIQAERRRFVQRYGGLSQADVARVVDDRYREFLSAAG